MLFFAVNSPRRGRWGHFGMRRFGSSDWGAPQPVGAGGLGRSVLARRCSLNGSGLAVPQVGTLGTIAPLFRGGCSFPFRRQQPSPGPLGPLRHETVQKQRPPGAPPIGTRRSPSARAPGVLCLCAGVRSTVPALSFRRSGRSEQSPRFSCRLFLSFPWACCGYRCGGAPRRCLPRWARGASFARARFWRFGFLAAGESHAAYKRPCAGRAGNGVRGAECPSPVRAISLSGGAAAGSARSRARDASHDIPFGGGENAPAPLLFSLWGGAPPGGPSGGPRALSYQKRNLEPSPLSYRGEGSAALPRQLWQPILSATRGPSGGLRSLSHQKRNPEPPPLSCRGGRFGRSLAAALAAGTAGRGSSGRRYYRRASLNSSSLAVPEASRRFAASAPALPRGMTGTPVCS